MTLEDRMFGTIWNGIVSLKIYFVEEQNCLLTVSQLLSTLSVIERTNPEKINLTCSITNRNRRMWYLQILLESLLLHCSSVPI